MLIIKTTLLPSPIHGIGLFSDEDIPAGTIIYKVDILWTKIFLRDYVESLSELEQEFFQKYAWSVGDLFYLSIDNDRFMNHSWKPNTYETHFTTVALRDIKKGEEITCDYSQLGLKTSNI
jgi:SET domain-containing protein